MTVALAIGVRRMARRNAIVRRLPAVETLGSVTVICTDKTGTLTRNEMMVERVALPDAVVTVTGQGYAPEGELLCHGAAVAAANVPGLVELARAGLLCNDAGLNGTAGSWCAEGDPMEAALVCLAVKCGLGTTTVRRQWPRTDVLPFDSGHRFMAALHHDAAGRGLVLVKGAPERLLEMCERQRGATLDEPLDVAAWYERMAAMAAQGMRLLGFAARPAHQGETLLRPAHLEEGLVFLGMAGLADPPREGAAHAIAACRQAGIRVVMITGDHAKTAVTIAERLGLDTRGGCLTGADLDALGTADLRERVAQVAVFARTSPGHKLRLVEALQATGEVVAMTGDGVNDAPALKRAQVGVAMGARGTEAAKEAAAIVLADDDFTTIAHAVEEGRTVYDNLRKAIAFILPTNAGEALVVVVAVLLGTALPITPVQILWVNMVTAVTLALALAFEPGEADRMRRPPRPPAAPLMDGPMLWRVGFVCTLLVAAVFGVFEAYRAAGADLAIARTMAVNTLVLGEIFYLLASRRLLTPAFDMRGAGPAAVAVAVVLALQLAFTYLAPMQIVFGTASLGLRDWLIGACVGGCVLAAVEVEKALLRRTRAP